MSLFATKTPSGRLAGPTIGIGNAMADHNAFKIIWPSGTTTDCSEPTIMPSREPLSTMTVIT